jgi:hypothetical protein
VRSARNSVLTDYIAQVEPTDKLPLADLQPILLGLFGEVGSIMATAKKFHREGEAYAGYRNAVEEEFGDALWYFAALCRRLAIRADEILPGVSNGQRRAASTSEVATPLTAPELDAALLQLGEAAAGLFVVRTLPSLARARLSAFADSYAGALKATRVGFAEVLRKNIVKTRGRFLTPDFANLPTFDQSSRDVGLLRQLFDRHAQSSDSCGGSHSGTLPARDDRRTEDAGTSSQVGAAPKQPGSGQGLR